MELEQSSFSEAYPKNLEKLLLQLRRQLEQLAPGSSSALAEFARGFQQGLAESEDERQQINS